LPKTWGFGEIIAIVPKTDGAFMLMNFDRCIFSPVIANTVLVLATCTAIALLIAVQSVSGVWYMFEAYDIESYTQGGTFSSYKKYM